MENSKMRMIVVPRLGGPEVLTVAEGAKPTPNADQVLVKLRYATITYGDVYLREGTYRGGAPLKEGEGPLRIGGEGTGTVAGVGANVKTVKEGDEVIFESPGAYAEYVAAPAARVVKVPKGVKLEDAASTLSIAGTAHYLSHDTVKLGPGMSCLVHAAAGGVGHILLQFAKLRGAQVLATVGNAEKARFVQDLGADRVILYNDEDFLAVAKAWGDGKGLDAVYDSVGKTTIKKSIQAVRHRGTCVLYGNSSGLVESIAPMELSATGSIYFTRPRLAHHLRTTEEIARRANDVFEAVGSGKMKFALAKIFPLERAAEAHALLQSRSTIGKILLSVA
jgi:NADPH2:quinone reductase